MGVRELSEIVGDTSMHRWRGPNVSRAVRQSLVDALGAAAASALCDLDGLELSGDARIDIPAWDQWDIYCFSEEIGSPAPFRIFAHAGGGDSWAFHIDTQTVFFLDHDGAETTVDMGVDVITFIRIADLWERLIERADCDGTEFDALEFHRGIEQLTYRSAEDFPWPYGW